MIKLALQWDVGLSEGTSKTGDIGPCWYADENNPLDNRNSKDLGIMRKNGIQSTMEKIAFDSSRATSFILIGEKGFLYNFMRCFSLVASLDGSLHSFYLWHKRQGKDKGKRGVIQRFRREREDGKHSFWWGWKWTCSDSIDLSSHAA